MRNRRFEVLIPKNAIIDFMKSRMKDISRLLSIPFILLAIYLLIASVWRLANLPSDSELQTIIKDYFNHYGLWVVFVGALIEGFLLLGQYFPGGFIIFLSVISAGRDIPRVIEIILLVSLAFFISYTLNYWVGKYGWHRVLIKFGLKKSLEDAEKKLARHGLNAIIFSYWEPNLASITATAAGVLKISLRQFSLFSAFGIVIWNIFWGTLVFSLGKTALQMIGLKYILIIFLVWVSVILIKHYIFDKKIERSISIP